MGTEPAALTRKPGANAATKAVRAAAASKRERRIPNARLAPASFGSVPIHAPVDNRSPLRIQPKLAIGPVDDPLEREADSVAARILGMPDPAAISVNSAAASVQRKCSCGGACPKCQADKPEKERQSLQLKHAGPAGQSGLPAPRIVEDALRSSGQPLDRATRAFMEPRFGRDFSQVRVHIDSRAQESARRIAARAYTFGHNIVFGGGQYAPHSAEGRVLLAHELAHVVQQTAGVSSSDREPVSLGGAAQRDTRAVLSAGHQTSFKLQRKPDRFAEPGLTGTVIHREYPDVDILTWPEIADEIAAVMRKPQPSWVADGRKEQDPRRARARMYGEHFPSEEARLSFALGALGNFESDRDALFAWLVSYEADYRRSRGYEVIEGQPTAMETARLRELERKKRATKRTCERLPEASGGKKCSFYVYDSTATDWLGKFWKAGAIADASAHGASYAIPSGKNMEEALETILSTYAEKNCDCTDEIQFWGHGSSGNGGWISQSSGGTDELTTASFDIPGLAEFGDDPQKPGYAEWRSKLSIFQRRLVLLRRTICDSDSTVYYRSCQAFQGKKGREFAKASSEFWRCDVVGHTKNIGLTQPGKKRLSVCQDPYWTEEEGAEEEGKKGKQEFRETKPR